MLLSSCSKIMMTGMEAEYLEDDRTMWARAWMLVCSMIANGNDDNQTTPTILVVLYYATMLAVSAAYLNWARNNQQRQRGRDATTKSSATATKTATTTMAAATRRQHRPNRHDFIMNSGHDARNPSLSSTNIRIIRDDNDVLLQDQERRLRRLLEETARLRDPAMNNNNNNNNMLADIAAPRRPPPMPRGWGRDLPPQVRPRAEDDARLRALETRIAVEEARIRQIVRRRRHREQVVAVDRNRLPVEQWLRDDDGEEEENEVEGEEEDRLVEQLEHELSLPDDDVPPPQLVEGPYDEELQHLAQLETEHLRVYRMMHHMMRMHQRHHRDRLLPPQPLPLFPLAPIAAAGANNNNNNNVAPVNYFDIFDNNPGPAALDRDRRQFRVMPFPPGMALAFARRWHPIHSINQLPVVPTNRSVERALEQRRIAETLRPLVNNKWDDICFLATAVVSNRHAEQLAAALQGNTHVMALQLHPGGWIQEGQEEEQEVDINNTDEQSNAHVAAVAEGGTLRFEFRQGAAQRAQVDNDLDNSDDNEEVLFPTRRILSPSFPRRSFAELVRQQEQQQQQGPLQEEEEEHAELQDRLVITGPTSGARGMAEFLRQSTSLRELRFVVKVERLWWVRRPAEARWNERNAKIQCPVNMDCMVEALRENRHVQSLSLRTDFYATPVFCNYLASSSYLKHLELHELNNVQTDKMVDLAAALRSNKSLESLCLIQIADELLSVLFRLFAERPADIGIHTLQLEKCASSGTKKLPALLSSPACPLITLILKHVTGFQPSEMRALVEHGLLPNSSVKNIAFMGCNFHPDCVSEIQRFLRQRTDLDRFCVNTCCADPAMSVLSCLNSNASQVQVLDVASSGGNDGRLGGACIQRVLRRNQNIRSLILSGCSYLGDAGIRSLSKVSFSKNHTLTELDLSGCGIRAEGLAFLIKGMVANDESALRTVNLTGNPIGDPGAIKIAENWLRHEKCRVETLLLNRCEMTEIALIAILRALTENCSLKGLHVAEVTRVGSATVDALIECLPQITLHYLNACSAHRAPFPPTPRNNPSNADVNDNNNAHNIIGPTQRRRPENTPGVDQERREPAVNHRRKALLKQLSRNDTLLRFDLPLALERELDDMRSFHATTTFYGRRNAWKPRLKEDVINLGVLLGDVVESASAAWEKHQIRSLAQRFGRERMIAPVEFPCRLERALTYSNPSYRPNPDQHAATTLSLVLFCVRERPDVVVGQLMRPTAES